MLLRSPPENLSFLTEVAGGNLLTRLLPLRGSTGVAIGVKMQRGGCGASVLKSLAVSTSR